MAIDEVRATFFVPSATWQWERQCTLEEGVVMGPKFACGAEIAVSGIRNDETLRIHLPPTSHYLPSAHYLLLIENIDRLFRSIDYQW